MEVIHATGNGSCGIKILFLQMTPLVIKPFQGCNSARRFICTRVHIYQNEIHLTQCRLEQGFLIDGKHRDTFRFLKKIFSIEGERIGL